MVWSRKPWRLSKASWQMGSQNAAGPWHGGAASSPQCIENCYGQRETVTGRTSSRTTNHPAKCGAHWMVSWVEVKPSCSFNRCQRLFASFHFKDWKSSRCIVLCSSFIVSCHLTVCDFRRVPEHKCGRSDETDSSSSKQTVLAWHHANLAPQENVLTRSTYSHEDFQQVNPPR